MWQTAVAAVHSTSPVSQAGRGNASGLPDLQGGLLRGTFFFFNLNGYRSLASSVLETLGLSGGESRETWNRILERQFVICNVTTGQKQLDKCQSQLAHPRHGREDWYWLGLAEEDMPWFMPGLETSDLAFSSP